MAQLKTRIRKNDTVEVISGSSAGKRGKVLDINSEKGVAVVEGLNMVFKHQKLNRDPNQPNKGRTETEAPINLSNMMLVCGKCEKPVRVGVKEEQKEDAQGRTRTRRVRVCKKCGEVIAERVS